MSFCELKKPWVLRLASWRRNQGLWSWEWEPQKVGTFKRPGALWLSFPSQVVMGIRTWAVWHRDRYVGIGLFIVMAGNFTINCILIIRFLKTVACKIIHMSFHIYLMSQTVGPAPYDGFRGCLIRITLVDTIVKANFTALTVLEIGKRISWIWINLQTHPFVVMLSLMALSAFRSCSWFKNCGKVSADDVSREIRQF